jgi:hypothetical protein
MTGLYSIDRGDIPGVDAIARVLERSRPSPVPRAADRQAWSQVAARPWLEELIRDLLQRAERAAAEGPAQVKATDYLDFARTGSRRAHSASATGRGPTLALLAAAECLEHRGRFMDAILDWSWATAEETSWIMPPHLQRLGDVLPDATEPPVDLRVADVAADMSLLAYLLGEEMGAISRNWRKRINYEVRRQAVGPYLERDFYWEDLNFNWNAVCTSGVVSASLLGDFDTETRARVIRKALRSVPIFLSGFNSDGGCSEGPSYWVYAMTNYSRMAYLVDCATGGEIDLLDHPVLASAYAYAAAMVLSGSNVVNFSDCPLQVDFVSGPVAWAAQRLGARETVSLASGGPAVSRFGSSALDLWLLPEPKPFEPRPLAVLPELMVAAVRGRGRDGEQLVLAAKGGHNGEHHNHNDVGNFIIHWRGESLICDLGVGDYVKEFFGPRRYEFLTTRSMGHNVPLINGVEQRAGSEFAARQFAVEEGPGNVAITMQLRDAYPPEAGLKSLRRSLRFERGEAESVRLMDQVEFTGDARSYRLHLYTEGSFEDAGQGVVRVRGRRSSLQVEFDPQVVRATVETVEHGDGVLQERFCGPALPRLTLTLRGALRSASVGVAFRPVG